MYAGDTLSINIEMVGVYNCFIVNNLYTNSTRSF